MRIEHGVPRRLRVALERAGFERRVGGRGSEARVVDEDRRRAEARGDRLRLCIDRGAIGDVDGVHRHRLSRVHEALDDRALRTGDVERGD